MKIRMISNGMVSEISSIEANELIQGAFMMPGNVKVKQYEASWVIEDSRSKIILTPILENVE